MVLHRFLWPQWRIGTHSYVVGSCMMGPGRSATYPFLHASSSRQEEDSLPQGPRSGTQPLFDLSWAIRAVGKMAQEGYAFRSLRHPGGLPCTGSMSVLSTALIQGKAQ